MGWLDDLRRSGWAGDDAKTYQLEDDRRNNMQYGYDATRNQTDQLGAINRRLRATPTPSPSPSPSQTQGD